MGVRQYVGARYVPIFRGEWDKTISYEPLTVVTHNGSSFTSKVFVPSGTEITNTQYWANTGNYNSQLNDVYEQMQALNEYPKYYIAGETATFKGTIVDSNGNQTSQHTYDASLAKMNINY